MKIRALAVVALSAVMMMAGVVRAQDMGAMSCFGLAEADCKVITDATNNTLSSITSFNQTWTIDVSATGIPDGANEGTTIGVTFNVAGSGPVLLDMSNTMMPFSFDQKLTVNADDGAGNVIEATVGAILSEGTLYVDYGDGWKSQNLQEAMSQEGSPFNTADLMSGDNPQVAQVMEIVTQLAPLAEVPGFLTYTRDGDNFTFVADFKTLIAAPEFTQVISQLSQGGDASVQQIAGLAGVLPMIVQEGKITIVQTVDTAANVVTGIDFNIDLTANAAMLAPTATEPIVLTVAFSVDLSDANAPVEIIAPADSTPMGN
jgi:hypothetical protein